ncbi:MAG: hypothetical protein HYV42_03240 [Candidatus Magasanikbacteria bacterium]|nr:hypothetical protein [Candidatus Magasanikbacteria bacterium]
MIIIDQLRAVLWGSVTILNGWLVYFVYKSNKKSITSWLFTILSISLQWWLWSIFLAFIYFGPFFPRLSMSAAVFINTSTFLLAYVLAYKKLPKKIVLMCLVIWIIITVPLTLSSYVFEQASTRPIINAVPGPAIHVFGIPTLILIFGAIYVLIKASLTATGLRKKQIQLFLYGIIGMFSCIIFTIFLPIVFFQYASFVQIAPLYVFLFLVCVAIAILKYQLFNVEILAIEGLAILLNGALFIQLLFSESTSGVAVRSLILATSAVVSYWFVKLHKRQFKQQEEIMRLKVFADLDKKKTEFLTIAAHQLRTPVSIISSYTSLIEEGAYGQVNAELKEVLDNMSDSTKWLVRLADEMMSIAHLEQNQVKYHFSQFDLGSLADGVAKELASKAREAKVKLVWQRPAKPSPVRGDAEKLRACMLNLLDNAIKYGSQEDRASAVTITLQSAKDGYRFAVADQGLGFAEADRAHFFEKFSRGDNARGVHVNYSSGLGLYIVKSFVAAHDGEVFAESPGLGQGSTFGFWVPRERKAE